MVTDIPSADIIIEMYMLQEMKFMAKRLAPNIFRVNFPEGFF